jgi:PKD repeat protein
VSGDGKPDLVTANQGTGDANDYLRGVSVLLGNGDGTFGAKVDYGTGSQPLSVAIADVSGDGKPDLVTANQGTGYASDYLSGVSVLLGNGNGTFAAKADYGTGGGSASVAVGDVSGDGKPDLAVAAGNGVSILLGNGNGTFGAAGVDFGTGSSPISVAIGDVSGDGRPDLAVANNFSSTVSVLLGNGDGTFRAKVDYGTGNSPRSVAMGDVNGDGKPDLAVANDGSNTVSVLLGNGDGTFRSKVDYGTGSQPYSVAMGDANGDGKPDLVAANISSSTVSVLLGNGDGTFGAKVDYVTGSQPISLAVGDVSGGGALDLVTANYGSNNVSVLLGNGDGTFGAKVDYGTEVSPYSVAIGDVSGDGKPDLAVANLGRSTVSIFLGNGAGTFRAKVDYGTGDYPGSVAMGDVNGDGKLDLVTANVSSSLSVLLGNGDGTFAAKLGYGTRLKPGFVAMGDVNGDGAPDLVTANNGSNTVSVLLNIGSRAHPPAIHAPAQVTVAEGAPVAFAITAVDPDGPAISSLTASFAGLPLGNNATFAANPTNTGGSFAWTPSFQDARVTPYLVTFTATNDLSGSGTTNIVVTNVNRGPVASAGGPYSAMAGSPLTLNGAGSSDPDGDALTYNWVYGDGLAGSGVNPVHTYAAVGDYGVALTVSDGSLSNLATTTASVVGILEARAFTGSGYRSIRLSAGKPQWCANVEPVGRSYTNSAVDLTTLVMKSPGTGSVSQIPAIQEKASISGDHDGNGVDEIEACFSKGDLRQLFGNLTGNTTVQVTIEGGLFAGGLFRAQMDVNVIASGGGQLAASVSPNPLNPEAILTFVTAKPGFARVDLFDLRGRLVRRLIEERSLPPGYHDVRIDGRDDHGERLATGIYFFRIHAAEGVETGQLTVLK